MPLVRSRAVVLQAFPYSETSKILRLLTHGHGLRSVIAKGALRPKSRYGGVLEPFTEGDALFSFREGRELHTLTGFDLVRSRQALGTDLAAFAGASTLAELALRSGTEEPHPELFDSLIGALDRLVDAAGDASRVEAEVLGAVWRVVALIGYRPELARCIGCGEQLAAGASCRFDVDGGGAACLRCRPVGRTIDAASRADLARMLAGRPARTVVDAPLQRALLRAFLLSHVAHDRPLRSLPLLLQQLH